MFLRRCLSKVCFALALLIVFGSQDLHAAPSFNVLTFKPASDHGFYLINHSSRTIGQNKIHGGLYFEFSDSSLVLVTGGRVRVRDIINKQLTLTAAAAYGITDWLNIGMVMSGALWQEFFSPTTAARSSGAQFGDLVIDAKFRLLDHDYFPIGLAIVPFVSLDTGSDSHFTSNGGVAGGGLLVIESPRFADRFSFVLNVGGEAREKGTLSATTTAAIGTVIDDRFLYGAALNVAITPQWEGIVGIDGWTKFSDMFGRDFRSAMAHGAVRYFPIPEVSVTLGGGGHLHQGMGAPTYRIFASAAYVPGYKHYQPCVDSDSDGICDFKDRCPTEGGPASASGCPANPLIEIDTLEGTILSQKIYFAFGRSQIRKVSYPILDELAGALKVRPDLGHIVVIGHTDHIGSHASNQKLSDNRAKAVYNYLVRKGVNPNRLSSLGKGETEPVATNTTDAGRALNRRVIFSIDKLKPYKVVKQRRKVKDPQDVDWQRDKPAL